MDKKWQIRYTKHNVFWTQVFIAYNEFHHKTRPMNIGEVLAEPICFNERIKVGGHLGKLGIRFLHTIAGLLKVSIV